ncbi:DUF2939 domain-containing protein [Mitsuaria sp. 7]|uniref:DUF2939 domain-containing protein n=1 Tax=Mitsuaria sp. 7 TaxID=1658665 RepID=UPI000832196D|nr:DUF2939 domain-containing protein [Mitsuaria sp. 7]
MTPTARKFSKVALVAAVLALAAYWYWSPWLAIHQMRNAAKAGDATAFNERVDYPLLRESLKGQLSGAIGARTNDRSESGSDIAKAGAALGSLFATAMVDRLVDAFVRPESVMRIMQEGKLMPRRDSRSKAPNEAPSDEGGETDGSATPSKREPIWTTERQGVDTFILYARRAGQAEDRRTGLVFQRRGFASWVLTEIRLPAL